MDDPRYFEERPCEDHGEIGRHYYQTPETYPSGEYKYEWCPGGVRREVDLSFAVLRRWLHRLGSNDPDWWAKELWAYIEEGDPIPLLGADDE